ncbi:MAG: hypothetical protein HKN92_09735 [Chitinophagales bacterium]|nr:hypothetical protein [Chitinophagales bacterium]
MKNRIILLTLVITALSVSAFAFINWKQAPHCVTDGYFPPNFFYDLGSRYNRTISKEEMKNITSISEFLQEHEVESMVECHSVDISVIDDDYNAVVSEKGESSAFTAEQIMLLQSSPYSTNILIRAEYTMKNAETSELEESYSTPHITIVPEKQAEYEGGKDAFIDYLIEINDKEQQYKVDRDKLKPGKVMFTVTADGKISNVKLSSTSGYFDIDNRMVGLIKNAPDKWTPAENANGEKVDQELVLSFGQIGC